MAKQLDQISSFQYYVFTFSIILTYVLFISLILGISFLNNPKYLTTLEYYLQIYIGLFLMWRFNYFRNPVFTVLDKKIAFSAGVFLLIATVVNSAIITHFKEIQAYIQSHLWHRKL